MKVKQDESMKFHKFFKGHYRKRNELVVDLLQIHKPKRIIEYAAGDSDIPELLFKRKGNYKPEKYFWSDREIKFVKLAAARLEKYQKYFEFKKIDVDTNDFLDVSWNSFDCLIANSPEHVNRDLTILASLKKECLVIMTLPKFLIQSGGHKRCFGIEEEVRIRYGNLIRIEKIIDLEKTINYKSWFVYGFKS
ncbi:MAG: hypothetical protein OEM46_00625 [Ignavibacteria bacterium]|nr:hypothetical protein [Ignavibacteria bacterium]